jgi:hypothetical protein
MFKTNRSFGNLNFESSNLFRLPAEAAPAKAGISIFGFRIFGTPRTSLVQAMMG